MEQTIAFAVEFLWTFVQLFAIFALPAFVVCWIRRDLAFWSGVLVLWFIVFFPLFTLINGTGLINYVRSVFEPWGVEGVGAFVGLEWALLAGSSVASVYAGLLMWFSRQKPLRGSILGFAWGALLLNACALVFCPWLWLGLTLWLESAEVIFYFVLLAIMTWYFIKSENCRNLYL